MKSIARSLLCSTVLCILCLPEAYSIEIVVDYTYDSEDFFDEPQRRDALQAAADRFSRIITSELLEIPADADIPWRIGFTHPGTGEQYQLTTAISRDEDPISQSPANEYGFAGLNQDEWILYAGGRNISSAGLGGTGTGVNFTTVFDDLDGPMHRGLISNTPEASERDLPTWGGAVAFDTDRDWHFGLDTAAPLGALDFYTIALHEVGHALGLNGTWNQWQQHLSGTQFSGENVVAAYNADNNASVTALSIVGGGDFHWRDGAYQSFIFAPGLPNQVGTSGTALQDILLEPTANFSATSRRFEVTNLDAAALVDLGWSILPSLDLNGDGSVDGTDVNLACANGTDPADHLEAIRSLPGDLDLDGQVQFSDFLIFSANFGDSGQFTDGDLTCDGQVQFGDFLIFSNNFGDSVAAVSVPEPRLLPSWIATLLLLAWRYRSR